VWIRIGKGTVSIVVSIANRLVRMTDTKVKFQLLPFRTSRFSRNSYAAKDIFGLCRPPLMAHWIRAVLPDHLFYRLSFCGSCLNITRN